MNRLLQREIEARAALERGTELMEAGDYAGASVEYDKAEELARLAQVRQ